ncbi:uro-adherence factor A-like isoform X2 [Palaemon carinicauda]|uniref:uro-adherence factor A-like isoform X2 n=1 Tax=Palaemon carinicauda TaxID=392227 RepID=UPI0035B6023A
MDREWTYRPPLLVGERVVWLGGSAGLGESEPCEYGPHHGFVRWIGRVPDMGLSWTVGVDFESEMTGGSDGAWKGRHIFTCQPGQGLFLPVSSLIKDEDFYGRKQQISSVTQNQTKTAVSSLPPSAQSMDKKPKSSLDISLAPEPPPPKVRSPSAPSYEIHTRNYLKRSGPEMDPSVYSALGVDGALDKKQSKFTHQAKDKGSSFFSTTVTSSVSSSPAATTSTTVYSSSVCSSTTYTSKEMVAGKFSHKGAQDSSQISRSIEQENTIKNNAQSSSVGKSGACCEYEDWSETGEYSCETMIKKSSLSSNSSARQLSYRVGQNRQSSVSTPSSPNLSDYQRNYGIKSSLGIHSSMLDIEKKSASLGGGNVRNKPTLQREKSGGFLNIFRWFRNKDKKKRSSSIDRESTNSGGSVCSLTSATSSFSYVPIMRSKSADNNKMSKRGLEYGISSKLLTQELSSEKLKRSVRDEELSKRLSTISASSDSSSKGGSRSTTISRKKRPAPQPPGSPKNSESGSLKSHKSCTSLPSRDGKPAALIDETSTGINIQGPDGRKLQKSKSEGLIYNKSKRRAPLPPPHLVAERMRAQNLCDGNQREIREIHKKRQAPAVPTKRGNRPISNVSSISSLSQSPSSASTTLKSYSSSVTSSETTISPYSTESFRLESGYLTQELKSSSSPSIPEATKMNLSPRPWYKRKKKQNKETKDLKDVMKKERVYESWMPDIQFSRSKISLSGSFKLGKSSDEDTLKKTKEDEKKEKRKSQVSLLANISELDRAATEQMQRELEEKRAKKELYDSKFYKSSEPHILTQTDFLPGANEFSDMSTLSSIGTSTTLKSTSKAESDEDLSHNDDGIYDNVRHPEEVNITMQSYSEQATLKIEERSNSLKEVNSACGTQAAGSVLQSQASSCDLGDTDSTPTPPARHSRESPLQRASFDAELFYKLAKDTQNVSGGKLKASPVVAKDQRKQQSDDDDDQPHESLLSQFRRQSKNFGLRMNNFFSPDVSTILEASESMTSSATTPADDIYEDLPVSSSVGDCGRRDSIQEELHSEINYDLRLNTSEAREIMKELADVRQEIARINQQEEEEAAKMKEKKKCNKIREEVLKLRERDNFALWQNVMKNTTEQPEENSPLPVDADYNERKLKWVCEVCTLINLPWRLQCEACMVRRPLNPKRVEDDNKSGTMDHSSSQPSVSGESPVTVIHGEESPDDNKEIDEANVAPTEAQSLDTGSKLTDNKKKRDINWERELRKYFMTFDEHVRGVGETASSSQAKSSDAKASSNSAVERDTSYGKITKNSKTTKPSPVNEVNATGAKPKTIKTVPIDSSNYRDFDNEPDLEELRHARTARFMNGLNSSESIELNSAENETTTCERKSIKKKKVSSKGKKSKSLDKEYYKGPDDENTVNQSSTNNTSEQMNGTSANGLANGTESSEDKSFYLKNYRKPLVMKPSGVVHNVVSIFNQLEELQQVKEKPKVTRRRSFSNVIGRTKAFEQMTSANNSPELPRSQKSFKESPSFPRKNDLMRDKDIVAAIAKFDEMAAMAEVERIEKQRVKNEMSRRKPKFSLFSNKREVKSNENGKADISKTSEGSSVMHPLNNLQNGNHSNTSTDAIVRNGVLHTENRNQSVAIGSGTFELIQAKDFESIEAQHSECSSPTESKSTTVPVSPPTNTQLSVVVPQIVINTAQDQTAPLLLNNDNLSSTASTGNEKKEQSQDEKQEVERLSQQLTVADGIANFKATLKVEEPNLGQMNTLNINRLLRRLEAAISCGKHAEAAKLAHELAELRVSCSVIRNPKDKISPESGTNSSAVSTSPTYINSSFLNSQTNEAELPRSHTPNNRLQTSTSAQSVSGKDDGTHSIRGDNPVASAQQADSKENSYSSIRENRVDPARREVKSDTISKFPDGPNDVKNIYEDKDLLFNVKMYVEDKKSHQGPFAFSVTASMTVGELREKVHQDFGFPPQFQRWILGRRLADDDNLTLGHHKVTAEGCPIFLYLVAPEQEPRSRNEISRNEESYAKYSLNQSNSRSSIDSAGQNYESAYNAEGVKPKFYNPDTQRYEISLDTDYSDLNDEEDEYDEDGNSTDNEEELQESSIEMYQNVTKGSEFVSESTKSDYEGLMGIQNLNTQQISENSHSREEPPAASSDAGASDSAPLNSYLGNISNKDGTPDEHSNELSENATYTKVDSLPAHQNEPIYQTNIYQDPIQQAELKAHQSNQETQSDTSGQKSHYKKQSMTPELLKQKRVIMELQHQRHYVQMPLVKQIATESHSMQSASHQEQQDIPVVTSNSSKTEEPYYNLQQEISSLSLSKPSEQQPLNVQNEPVKPQQVIPVKSQTPQEKSANVPTPSRSSSLNFQQKIGQMNQAQNSPNTSQTKSIKSPQTSQFLPVSLNPPTNPNEAGKSVLYPLLPNQQSSQNVQLSKSVPLYSQVQQKTSQISGQQTELIVNNKIEPDTAQATASPSNSKDNNSSSPQALERVVDKKDQESAMNSSTKVDGWICPSCTFVNKWERPGCEVCTTERPSAAHNGTTNDRANKLSSIGAAMSALELQGYVPNQEPFECRVCFMDIETGEGAVLRDCLHTFCRDCLANAIKFSDTAEVKCPYRDTQYSCDFSLQDREIKALLTPEEYEKHLNKSVKQAEGAMQNVFHCKTPDCLGFCQFEDNVNLFLCDVCKRTNCLTCQAQHEGKSCQSYQDELAWKVDEAAMKTKKFFDDMIRRGDGLPCPKCSVMLVRKWGCDWMRCPMCRTEICWVTRGPRWGPGGQGDNSGGCKCGVRGRKCHPKCTYCH